MARVQILGAFVHVITQGAQNIVYKRALVAFLAGTVIPPNHIDTHRRIGAAMKVAGAFIDVAFATGTHVSMAAGTHVRFHTHSSIQAPLSAYRSTLVAIACITRPAHTVITTLRVNTIRIRVTVVFTRTALVQFGAIKLVHPSITGQAFTYIGTFSIYTFCIQMTVVPFQPALLLTLVDITASVSVALEALIAMTSVSRLQIQAGGISVTSVSLGAVICPWAKLAALARHRELLVG